MFAFPGETLTREAAALSGAGDFCAALDKEWRVASLPSAGESGLPFRGGWFLYLGYELAAQIETRLQLPGARGALPTARRSPSRLLSHHRSYGRWKRMRRRPIWRRCGVSSNTSSTATCFR